jgi:pyridoxal phosphate enzyme (YggS family)
VNPNAIKDHLRERLQAVEQRIASACRRAGRERGDVTLVAVTKTIRVEVAAWLQELGVLDLGESRPQELWRKAAALPSAIRWHLIGHLQRNKIEQTLPLVELIHSVDSLRLLTALEEAAAKVDRPAAVLLEVNASREANKHGFTPEEVENLAEPINRLDHVQVRGLMTMAAWEDEAERCRPTFALLRELRGRLRGRLQPPHALEELSMGMSNDFEIAVEEGATLVRLGTVLFGGFSGEET